MGKIPRPARLCWCGCHRGEAVLCSCFAPCCEGTDRPARAEEWAMRGLLEGQADGAPGSA